MRQRLLLTTLASAVALSAAAGIVQAQTKTESKGLFGFQSPLDTVADRKKEKASDGTLNATRDAKKKKSKSRTTRAVPRGSFY